MLQSHSVQKFKKERSNEYLPSLVKRYKWNKANRNIQVGDIVVIVDANGPRNTWKKGKIVKVFPGSDGRIRVAEVWRNRTLKRPISKLCVLDVRRPSI